MSKDETGKIRKDKEGKTIYEETERARAVMRQYTVFNVEQADGLKLPPRETPATPEWDTHREADKVLRASGAKVQHVSGGDRAYYRMAEDKIVLPDPSQFATRNGYYQTALHEAGHSTGHHDRMNRDTLKEGMAAGEAQKMTNYLMDRAITQEREHPTKTKAELTQEFSHTRGPQIGQTPKQPVAALTQTQERDMGPSR